MQKTNKFFLALISSSLHFSCSHLSQGGPLHLKPKTSTTSGAVKRFSDLKEGVHIEEKFYSFLGGINKINENKGYISLDNGKRFKFEPSRSQLESYKWKMLLEKDEFEKESLQDKQSRGIIGRVWKRLKELICCGKG